MTDTFYLPPDDPDMDRDYISGEDFQKGTRTAVRTLSSDFDTNVIFAGNQAKTDGQRVILPNVPHDKMMTHRQVEVGRGYANHETLHKLLTDFDNGKAWLRKHHESGKHFTASMGQAIEDVRIENGGLKLYSGIGKSVDKTAEQVCREFKKVAEQQPEICSDPWQVLPVAVTWAGRIKLGYPSETIKQPLDNLSKDIQDRANKIADVVLSIPHGVTGVGQVNQVEAYKGWQQGSELAERVANELAKDIPPPEIQPDPRGEGEGNGDGKDVTEGEGKGKGTGGDEGEDTEATQDTSTERSHGASQGSYEKTLIQTEPHPFNPELDQVVSHITDDTTKKNGTSIKHFCPYTTDDDKIETPRQVDATPDIYRKTYDKITKKMGSRLATMRRKLEKALITKVDVDYESSTNGRLNIRGKASSIISGSDIVRRRRVEGNEIDTAVSLLVDCSGSMSGQPMALAGQSAIALAECLHQGRIPFEVIGHTTMRLSHHNRDNLYNERYNSDGISHRYTRTCAIYMPLFKPFEKDLRQCKHTMGFIPTASDNSNADAEAILMATERLRLRQERNKILMVLADGYPAWSGDHGCQATMTREAVELIQNKYGVKAVGIGINCDSVSKFFERYVVVNEIDDLAKNCLDQIAKMILGERFNVDNSQLIGK